MIFQYYFYNVVPFEYHFINNCQVSVGYFALQQMPIGKNIMISKYFYKCLLITLIKCLKDHKSLW